MQIPNSVSVLRRRLRQAGVDLTANDRRGAFTGLLASSRGSGIYLCSGDDSLDCVGWIIDALDMSGRLVVHRNSSERIESLTECYNTDLRISVHAQGLAEFLDDVKHHRFELIVLCRSMCDAQNIQRTAAALSDGGFLLLCQCEPEATAPQLDAMSAFVFSDLEGVGTVIARRRSDSHPRRRGGRRRRDS